MVGFVADVRDNLRSPVTLGAWLFLTAMMAVAGPFGSYDHIPIVQRALFWAVIAALSLVVAVAFRVVVFRRLGWCDYWRSAPLIGLAVTAVMTFPLQAIAGALTRSTGYMPPGAGESALFIFCLSMGFCALRAAIEGLPAELELPAEEADVPPAPPRLLDRLPGELRAPVIRIAVRNHHVDVFTEKGAHSLLMRFSDAIAEMEGQDGVQVHRSHWVAASAVTGVEREGGRLFVRTSDGTRVPGSRSCAPQVEAQLRGDQA